jgi:hypothetical protein
MIISALVLCLALIGAAQLAVPGHAQTAQRCFNETDYCISGRIGEYWEQNGGLPVFGFPTGQQREEVIEGNIYQAQWFERHRLELHPNNEPPYDVLLGRLGVTRLEMDGRDWDDFPKDVPRDGCLFFEQTRQNVCEPLLTFWQTHGLEFDGQAGISYEESLALFGLPISGTRVEELHDGNEYVVQWFERARFEIHPENDPPYNVLLGLLGNETRPGELPALPTTTPTATTTASAMPTGTLSPTPSATGSATPTATATGTATRTPTPTITPTPVPQPTVIEDTPSPSSLSVDKVASVSDAQPGAQFTYNLAVRTTESGMSTVTLNDTVDANLEIVQVLPAEACTTLGELVTCSLQVTNNEPARVAIIVRVQEDAQPGTVMSNQARLSVGGESTYSNAVYVRVQE